jgi:hypothetical protein
MNRKTTAVVAVLALCLASYLTFGNIGNSRTPESGVAPGLGVRTQNAEFESSNSARLQLTPSAGSESTNSATEDAPRLVDATDEAVVPLEPATVDFSKFYAAWSKRQLEVRQAELMAEINLECRDITDARLAQGLFELEQGRFDPENGGYTYKRVGEQPLGRTYSIPGEIGAMRRVDIPEAEYPDLYRKRRELQEIMRSIREK